MMGLLCLFSQTLLKKGLKSFIKGVLLIWVIWFLAVLFLTACPVYEAAVKDKAGSETSTSSSSSN
tara:strand:- start:179 stop:373 length:195 start_codon:yes stop_codon:yes gene_type:complete